MLHQKAVSFLLLLYQEGDKLQEKSSTNVKIIDVSHWQGAIDWEKVKDDGVKGVFIKATEGTSYVDPKFKENAINAKKAGLKIGFYHFAHPNNDPVKEVEHFLKTIKDFQNDLPLVLDLENNKGLTKSQVTAFAEKWLNEIIKRTGQTPLFYSYTSFIKSYIDKSLNKFPLWIAQYTTALKPSSNGIWNEWKVWQYSDSGKVNGINGNVDLNYMELDFWNQWVGGRTMSYEYNKVYKERVYASGGKLIRCDGNYNIKATDVRFIRFPTGKTKYRFVAEKNAKVSSLVKKYGANFGFNGPFFNLQTGEIYGNAKDGDKIIAQPYGKMLKRHELVVIDGKPYIGQYDINTKCDMMIQGAPLLIENGALVYEKYRVEEEVQDDVGKSRCQRTFVWIDGNGDLWWAVADGRTNYDQGLTLEEMALFAKDKGAKWALNFDGGGSSIIADQTGGLNQSANRGANERTHHHAVLVYTNVNTSSETSSQGIHKTIYPVQVDLIDSKANKTETVDGYIIDNYSFIPIRVAGNFFNVEVGWDGKKASLKK